jgi:myosin heavy subunit
MGKDIDSYLNKTKSMGLRDTLSKDLFEKLFNWLVKRLNVNLIPPEDKYKDPSTIT